MKLVSVEKAKPTAGVCNQEIWIRSNTNRSRWYMKLAEWSEEKELLRHCTLFEESVRIPVIRYLEAQLS